MKTLILIILHLIGLAFIIFAIIQCAAEDNIRGVFGFVCALCWWLNSFIEIIHS